MASVELATAYVSLVPTMKGAQGSIARELGAVDADGIGKDVGGRMGGGIVGTLKGLIGPAVAVIGSGVFAGFIGEAARASDATDKFKSTMSFAGLDTTAITEAKDAAKAYADQTIFDLPTIQNTIAQLASNGVADYTGLTKAAGNLNAVAGGNADTFRSVAMVMTQSAGAGKLTTENWNQLADAIPGAAGPLMKALEQAGAYTGNFREAMEKGQITSDEFNAALMKLGTDPVAVEAAKSTATFEGALGGLKSTINSGLMSALDSIKPATTGAINALSGGLSKAFVWTGLAAQGLYDLIVKGDFSGAFATAFKVEEDSPVVDFLFDIRDAAKEAFTAIKSGDFSSMSSVWESFLAVARPAGPILVEVGTALGGMSQEIGKIIASGLPLIIPILQGAAGVMQFLADNTGILTAGIIALAAGLVVWRLAQIAGNIAAVAAVPVAAAQAASNFALASAIRAQTAATATDTVANGVNTGSRLAAIGSLVASGVALAAAKAAQLAGAVATGVATAAQWAWNAALTANPIGIVIVAIAALVGALVWFFTQTELGRAIFQSVFQFIQATVAGALGWFSGVLLPTFAMVWGVVRSGLSGLGSFFADTWGNIVNGVSSMIGNVVGFFSGLIGRITGAIGNAGNALFSVGKNIIQGLIDGIGSMMGSIGRAVINIVPAAIRGPFESLLGIASPSKVFRGYGVNIGQGLILGIDDMHAGIEKSVNGMVTVPSAPAYGASTSAGDYRTTGGFGSTFNIYETDDPIATAHAVSRRQSALGV